MKITEDQAEKIAVEYALDKSLQEIASTYGVSQGTIRTVLKKRNITLRPRGRRPNKKVASVVTGESNA